MIFLYPSITPNFSPSPIRTRQSCWTWPSLCWQMSGVAPILEQVWVFLLHRFHVATQNLNDLGASCAAVVLRNRAELFCHVLREPQREADNFLFLFHRFPLRFRRFPSFSIEAKHHGDTLLTPFRYLFGIKFLM